MRHPVIRKAYAQKLLEAGEAWADLQQARTVRPAVTSEYFDQLVKAKAPLSIINQVRARLESEHFYVDHDNWAAWEIFEACTTQWRVETLFVPGMKKPHFIWRGLDYPALESVMNIYVKNPRERRGIFDQVRLIEMGALKRLNS